MRPRPRLHEAISCLTALALQKNEDAIDVLAEYHALKLTNEFLAARLIIEVVVSINEFLSVKDVQHG